MNGRQAAELLAGRLVFGDQLQIEALQTLGSLHQVNQLFEEMDCVCRSVASVDRPCSICWGRGVVEPAQFDQVSYADLIAVLEI